MSLVYKQLAYLASLSGNALKSQLQHCLPDTGADGDALRRYIMAVLDPMTVYHVKGKLLTDGGTKPWDEDCYGILSKLASREYTGNAAKNALKCFTVLYDPEAVELMNRALNKDLRCGVGIALINDLGLDFKIPVFECQLAQPGEAKRMKDGEDWLGCIKYDGMRALIEVNDNRVSFWTRSGKPIKALQAPLYEQSILNVFGGRRLMLDSEGVSNSFLETVSSLRSHGAADDAVLMLFDIVDLDEFRKARNDEYFGGKLVNRLRSLGVLFDEAGVDPTNGVARIVTHLKLTDGWNSAVSLANQWMEQGLEGGVFKRASAGYIKRRTYDWLKIKLEDEITARVIGVYEGEAGKQFEGMLGGVTVEIDGVESDVGGGWTPAQRAEFWPDQTTVVGRLIDIKCNGKTPSGALRHARFVRFRDVDGEIA